MHSNTSEKAAQHLLAGKQYSSGPTVVATAVDGTGMYYRGSLIAERLLDGTVNVACHLAGVRSVITPVDRIRAIMVQLGITGEGLPRWVGPTPYIGDQPLSDWVQVRVATSVVCEGDAAEFLSCDQDDFMVPEIGMVEQFVGEPFSSPEEDEAFEAIAATAALANERRTVEAALKHYVEAGKQQDGQILALYVRPRLEALYQAGYLKMPVSGDDTQTTSTQNVGVYVNASLEAENQRLRAQLQSVRDYCNQLIGVGKP
jgi:hypothetical protein